jgi:hypothetical protein
MPSIPTVAVACCPASHAVGSTRWNVDTTTLRDCEARQGEPEDDSEAVKVTLPAAGKPLRTV